MLRVRLFISLVTLSRNYSRFLQPMYNVDNLHLLNTNHFFTVWNYRASINTNLRKKHCTQYIWARTLCFSYVLPRLSGALSASFRTVWLSGSNIAHTNSIGPDQTAQMRSLVRAFAIHLWNKADFVIAWIILLHQQYISLDSENETVRSSWCTEPFHCHRDPCTGKIYFLWFWQFFFFLQLVFILYTGT